MKKRAMKYALIGLAAALPSTAVAADFFDIIDSSVTTVNMISSVHLPFNGALVTASWYDGNSDGKLDTGEQLSQPVKIFDRNGNLVLGSPNQLDRTGLEAWAEANATAIYNALFPGGVSQGISVSNLSAQISQQRLFQKVVAKKKTEGVRQNNEFSGAVEYDNLDVDNASGNAYSVLMGHSHETASGLEFGFSMPYRYTDMSDDINSKSHFVGLEPFMKKTVLEENDFSVAVGATLVGSIFYLQTDAIEDAGSLTYGAGMFTSFTKALAVGTLSGGVDYKYTKAYLPDSLTDSNNAFVDKAIDYVNDLDPVHTISYGLNYGVPVNDSLAINLQAIRSNFISDDIDNDRDSQTVAGINASYLVTDTFELNLGVNSIFELKDIDSYGITLSSVFRF